MFSNSMLVFTSISQWMLFAGIALILFGWIEKRNHFVLSGQLIFLALGFLGLWVIFNYSTPLQPNSGTQIPKEVRILAYFKGVALFMGLTVLTLMLELFKIRYRKFGVYALVFFALMLFFMVFNIQQMAG